MLSKTKLSRMLAGCTLLGGAVGVATAPQAGTFTVANQDITLNGGAAGGYFYTTNTGSSKQDNFFLTDFLAELSSEAKTGGVGFTAALANFQQVSILDGGVNNCGTTAPDCSTLPISPDYGINLLYGYVSVAPVEGLKIDTGKLVTNVGYEVPQSFANPNIALGTVWYFEPAYYPGVRATYSWNDITFYGELNKNDTFTANSMGAEPGGAVGVSGSVAGFNGSFSYYEQIDQKRVLDFIIKKTVGTVDLAANLDYQILSKREKDLAAAGTDDNAFGVEFYATVPVMAKVTVPVRVGYISDGTSGIYGLGAPGASNNAVSFTITPTYHFTDNTFVRAEVAYIKADKKVFTKSDGVSMDDNKTTFGLQSGILF
jgi:hypothetical protein